MKKIGLAGIVSNPSTAMYSHNAGWTLTLCSIIENHHNVVVDVLNENDDWNSYDLIYLSEGVNFKGTFNFFGGVQQKQIDRLNKLYNYNGELLSLSGLIDYNVPLKKRKELSTLDMQLEIPKEVDILKMSDKLVLGDSHSISVFKKGYTISRNDGKTLRGFLKKGIKSYIPNHIKELVFYAGNIDVRFHMFNVNRNGHYTDLCIDLVSRLEKQLLELCLDKITCVKLLPIEDESRKIPNTGKLDGLSFYGSRLDRLSAVLFFNNELEHMCKRNNFEILNWDFSYDEALSFDNMEARQSVHLRPSKYMFNQPKVSSQLNLL